MENVIEIKELSKTFKLKKNQKGFLSKVTSIFSPSFTEVKAVDKIDLNVQKGERVAFIGPNGAGKSTTIKMLSGILSPSHGKLSVLGYDSFRDRKKLSYHIGTVFGQKSQLWYHLPANDTFNLLAKIYSIAPLEFKKRKEELVELFQLNKFIHQKVRQMSLGQRMRCEIVASLLHGPQILFLDEPTIGLDVTAKAVIRDIIKKRSQDDGTTLFLTSHDTGDMESVCDRVVIINDGKIIIDSSIEKLRKDYIHSKLLTFSMNEKEIDFNFKGVKTVDQSPHSLKVKIDLKLCRVEEVMTKVMSLTGLRDINVEDPPMEEIISRIYGEKIYQS